MRSPFSRQRVNVRDLFSPPMAHVDPRAACGEIRAEGSPVSPVYDGPIPELATIARTPPRRPAQRINVVPRRWVQFGTTASRPDIELAVSRPIPTHGWVRGLLVGRLHAIDTFPTTSAVNINVQNVDTQEQDPSIIFFSATPIATIQYRSSDVAPKLYRDDFIPPGPCIRLVLNTTCTGSTPTGTLRIAISVDLVGYFT